MLQLLIQNNCFFSFPGPWVWASLAQSDTTHRMGRGRGSTTRHYGVLGLDATVPLGPCTPKTHSTAAESANAQAQAQAPAHQACALQVDHTIMPRRAT